MINAFPSLTIYPVWNHDLYYQCSAHTGPALVRNNHHSGELTTSWIIGYWDRIKYILNKTVLNACYNPTTTLNILGRTLYCILTWMCLILWATKIIIILVMCDKYRYTKISIFSFNIMIQYWLLVVSIHCCLANLVFPICIILYLKAIVHYLDWFLLPFLDKYRTFIYILNDHDTVSYRVISGTNMQCSCIAYP